MRLITCSCAFVIGLFLILYSLKSCKGALQSNNFDFFFFLGGVGSLNVIVLCSRRKSIMWALKQAVRVCHIIVLFDAFQPFYYKFIMYCLFGWEQLILVFCWKLFALKYTCILKKSEKKVREIKVLKSRTVCLVGNNLF